MSMQQFCLRWNNHQPNFISVFSNLLNNETLVDVTLAAEGRHLQAHKIVLSACSTYFQSLFTVNPCQHPIVILKDVKFSDLKIMVDFMYYGEVNISQDQLPSIIKTAESLKIKGLAEMHTASLTKWPNNSGESEGVSGGGIGGNSGSGGGSGGGGNAGNRGNGERGESSSPSPLPLSPTFRRKRLRKSSTGSTSGSVDKPEEINEITLVATNIVKPEPSLVPQENRENLRRSTINTTGSQGNIDDDQVSIMRNMENNSAATSVQSDGSLQDVNQTGSSVPQSSASSQPPTHQVLHSKHTSTKRGPRLLTRQPRVKKELESIHLSPDSDPGSPHIVLSSVQTNTSISQLSQSQTSVERRATSSQATVVSQTNLVTIPASTNLLSVPTPSYLIKQHSHPLLPTQQPSGNYNIHRQHSNPEFPRRTVSPSIVVEPAPTIKFENETPEEQMLSLSSTSGNSLVQSLKAKIPEFRRSSSSPQTSSKEFREGSSDQRFGHCPVQRPGPALGCNHCWNTIDGHGRILRRKTKYHCPECQINLCIVPCFQEFHERQREFAIHKSLPKTSSI